MKAHFFVRWLLEKCHTLTGERGIKAMGRWCDTGTAIDKWRKAHPGLDIGCDKHGQRLARNHLGAYLDFLDAHPFVERNEVYLIFLCSLTHPAPCLQHA